MIYFIKRDGRWKIYCQTDFGGWNLSQIPEDPSLPYPPLGQWREQDGGGDAPRSNGYKAVFEQVIFYSFFLFIFLLESFLFKKNSSFLFFSKGGASLIKPAKR